ncbi:MAG: hypothetical protein GY847_14860, partial [Proteobacteria bacterium]|nr:hypothetical protein [Pseudomonadota bacterium]
MEKKTKWEISAKRPWVEMEDLTKTTYSIASAVLITAICSAGCYRTVARIHVDASHNLIVNKTENAKDDQVPPVVKTEGGLQEVRIDRKR